MRHRAFIRVISVAARRCSVLLVLNAADAAGAAWQIRVAGRGSCRCACVNYGIMFRGEVRRAMSLGFMPVWLAVIAVYRLLSAPPAAYCANLPYENRPGVVTRWSGFRS